MRYIRSAQCHLPGQMVDPPTVPWKQTGETFSRVFFVLLRVASIVCFPTKRQNRVVQSMYVVVVKLWQVQILKQLEKLKRRLYRAKFRPREVREPGTQRRIRWTRSSAKIAKQLSSDVNCIAYFAVLQLRWFNIYVYCTYH